MNPCFPVSPPCRAQAGVERVTDIMRLGVLFLMFLALWPVPARAQQDVLSLPGVSSSASRELLTDEQDKRAQYANQYYHRCSLQRFGDISAYAQDETCMCHAVHMIHHLRIEEMEVMGTGKGRYNVNRAVLLPQVYGPCMEFIVQEVEEQACYEMNRVRSFVRTQEEYQGVCKCAAREMAAMVRETASAQLAAMLARKMTVEDPYESIMRSESYQRERSKIITSCMKPYIK